MIVGGIVFVLMEMFVDFGMVVYFVVDMFMIGIYWVWFMLGDWIVFV